MVGVSGQYLHLCSDFFSQSRKGKNRFFPARPVKFPKKILLRNTAHFLPNLKRFPRYYSLPVRESLIEAVNLHQETSSHKNMVHRSCIPEKYRQFPLKILFFSYPMCFSSITHLNYHNLSARSIFPFPMLKSM